MNRENAMPFVYAAPLHPGSTDVVYTAADGTKTLRRGGSRAWRNNNPGNIESGKFAKSQGAIGQTGRFAVFPDVQTGRAAVFALLHKSIYINLSVADAVAKYAPPSDNDTENYKRLIAKLTSLDTMRKLSSLSSDEFTRVIDAVGTVEGYFVGSELPIQRVVGAKSDGKRLTQVLIEGYNSYISMETAIQLAESGQLDVVVVRRAHGTCYLRSRADGFAENNLSAIATRDVRHNA